MFKSGLLWLGLLIVWLVFGAWISNKYFCSTDFVSPASNAAVVPIVKSWCDATLNVTDSNDFSFSSKENFKFFKSKFEYLPISSKLESGMKSISEYLKAHPERMISIEGRYETQEENTSILPNLGLARGNFIKKSLVKYGAPVSQINVVSKSDVDLCYAKDTINNGVELTIGALVNDADRLSQIKSRLMGKPIILYFETNSDNLTLSEQQRQDFADLNYYLDHVPASKLAIGGHTDNRGAKKYNEKLSQDRADFVRQYVQQNAGISENRMSTKGYGRSTPISSNKTEEGRQQNRRVEVILK